jgi:peptidoglycan/xylan/chitin deacetylase (PgdA/CDA1 family)
MRRVNSYLKPLVLATFLVASWTIDTPALAQSSCKNPVYLTLDTGHMEVAPLMVDVLRRQQVKVTFFVANERTKTGDGSLGNAWGTWWKSVAGQGHEFASHTYDHVYWRGDLKGVKPSFRMQPSAGAFEGREFTWEPAKYCEQIKHAAERIQDFTGKKPLPLFRAPGGKTSPRLLEVASACGFAHVGWAPAGFLGDELPSEKYSNDMLLKKALRDIRSGDILMAHLGIWSRKDPWAPANLEPLIVGLKERGFCFETLRNHPAYRDWIASHGG